MKDGEWGYHSRDWKLDTRKEREEKSDRGREGNGHDEYKYMGS